MRRLTLTHPLKAITPAAAMAAAFCITLCWLLLLLLALQLTLTARGREPAWVCGGWATGTKRQARELSTQPRGRGAIEDHSQVYMVACEN